MIKFGIFALIVWILWFVMFSPWTTPHINFWLMMSLSAVFLISSSLYIQWNKRKELYSFKSLYILIGISSAFVLYMIFLIGNIISRLIFSFAGNQVGNIYALREQSSALIIGILIILIGAAEEVFWRGFVQNFLSKRYTPFKGYLIASIFYAMVHIWSFNFMLVMASLVCGLFWGLIYLKYRSLWPTIISHVIWDLFIFVLVPLH